MRSLGLALLILAISLKAHSAFQFPTNLGGRDRDRITEIIGLGNSTKLNSNPYPLGGYSGVEIGYSMEQINTEDVGRLGSTANTQRELNYSRISFGKGLYNNLDIFAHFIPYTESVGYSDYGGLLRYCFYQPAFVPASFSIILHANSSNIGNVFFAQAKGIELVTGLNVGDLSIYGGFGQVWATGLFSKTLNAPENGSSQDQRTYIAGIHTFLGTAFDFEPYFIAFQVDQYTQTAFSGKLGLRF